MSSPYCLSQRGKNPPSFRPRNQRSIHRRTHRRRIPWEWPTKALLPNPCQRRGILEDGQKLRVEWLDCDSWKRCIGTYRCTQKSWEVHENRSLLSAGLEGRTRISRSSLSSYRNLRRYNCPNIYSAEMGTNGMSIEKFIGNLKDRARAQVRRLF